MSIRRIASIILLLLLNLILGFIYIEPIKVAVTLISSSANESEVFTENTLITKDKKITGNATNETFTGVATPEITLPLHFNFMTNPQDLCTRGTKVKSKLSLLILVCTAVSNAKQRETIRRTWGSIASENNNTDYVRLGFLIGSTKSAILQEQIEQESAKYSDIIQQDFVDSYKNLTLKSIMLLKWVSVYCPNVQYVLKTDDDMYVNVPNLINALIKLPVKSNVMYGVLFRRAKPNRHPTAKWYVPKNQFEGDTFPDYLSGTAYVMSRDVTPKLLEASSTIPFLVMEDVFITGLCAGQSHVKRYNVRGFAHWKRPPTGCAFKDAITGHHVTTSDMKKIWKELQRKPLMCRIIKKKS